MPKSINLGNGTLLVGLNEKGLVKDFYFPYPGLENHVGENLTHKIGVFVDNMFSWLTDDGWKISVRSKTSTMASEILATNESFGLTIGFKDVVYNEKNIFLRHITVKNDFDRIRSLKLFINQEFNISETHIGDTAYFDPRDEVIIHYKGRRVFLINSFKNGKAGFEEYSIGLIGIEGQVGTWMDAEDGSLSGNPIEHGQVDSVIANSLELPAGGSSELYYWITVAKSLEKAKQLNEEIISRNPEDLITTTCDFWKAWSDIKDPDFGDLSDEVREIYKKSLLFIRVHCSDNGAIIASGDSEMLQFGRDYYRYVWPRDGSFAAVSLARSGDVDAAKRFFGFAADLITSEGYFMHKYRPDKSLGSSWHPWIHGNKAQFPIQEDETALVIWGLWKYFETTKDIEFIEDIYNSLIKKAADFMCSYLDDKTALPKASYDIWEQIYGISTFTASTVYGALTAAAGFAELLGKKTAEKKYKDAAESIRTGILKYLYDQEEGYFYKLLDTSVIPGKLNKTIDISSIYGIYKFKVLETGDKIFRKALDKTIERLEVKTEIGGVARYEGDMYHFKGGNYPGNPWIITTLWYAQYLISIASKKSELKKPKELINWAVRYAGPAGTLPEQLDPYTGEHLSASPLIWSHGEFINTVLDYLEKLKVLKN